MSQMQQIIERGNNVLIGNYARIPISLARGEGSIVWDADGKRYVNLFAGFGAAIIGHCHPALIDAVNEQARRLWHVGNTFYTEPQIEVAERLNRHTFAGKAFFCHSGLEANEAACKLSRLRGNREHKPGRWKIISLQKSFHGRSLAMIAATGNAKVKEGFEPAVPGFTLVEFGNLEALEKAIDSETGGIIIEPIQGEGGMNLHPPGYVQRVREICDERGLTLIFDEVWTGTGRTGKWFAHQYFEKSGGGIIEPDIMTLGKAIGGGLPVGVMYARAHVAKHMVPGTHGCTLGANCLSMAAARTVLDVIEREQLLDHANEMGQIAVAQIRRRCEAGREDRGRAREGPDAGHRAERAAAEAHRSRARARRDRQPDGAEGRAAGAAPEHPTGRVGRGAGEGGGGDRGRVKRRKVVAMAGHEIRAEARTTNYGLKPALRAVVLLVLVTGCATTTRRSRRAASRHGQPWPPPRGGRRRSRQRARRREWSRRPIRWYSPGRR